MYQRWKEEFGERNQKKRVTVHVNGDFEVSKGRELWLWVSNF
jgi:hypothetical protein